MDRMPGMMMRVVLGLGCAMGTALASEEGTKRRVVAPMLQPNSADLSHCYPHGAASLGREGVVVVRFVVQPDGTATDPQFALGTEPWQQQAARCVLANSRFRPGMVDGVVAAVETTMPVTLGIVRASGKAPEFHSPEIRSNAEAIRRAHHDCYPASTVATQTPVFRFTVGVDGRARNVRLLKSGGDPRLDKAGACIVKKLQFKPLLRGSQAVRSTVSMPIELSPPQGAP